jgi:hypothetical protein
MGGVGARLCETGVFSCASNGEGEMIPIRIAMMHLFIILIIILIGIVVSEQMNMQESKIGGESSTNGRRSKAGG